MLLIYFYDRKARRTPHPPFARRASASHTRMPFALPPRIHPKSVAFSFPNIRSIKSAFPFLHLFTLFRSLGHPPHLQSKTLHLPHFFFGGNLGFPISLPRNLTPSTLSMLDSTFWSGVAVPRSKSATMLCVVLHRVARSFCVIFGSIFCRHSEITAPTSLPTVVGLTMSSDRSTLVRCCPSTPGREACIGG